MTEKEAIDAGLSTVSRNPSRKKKIQEIKKIPKNKQINIRITDDQFKILSLISEIRKKTMSNLVGSLLDLYTRQFTNDLNALDLLVINKLKNK